MAVDINQHLKKLGVDTPITSNIPKEPLSNIIKKGVSNTFYGGESKLKYKKSGTEIKENLKKERISQCSIKDNAFQKIITIRMKILMEPTETINDWMLRGVNINKENLPKQYSYRLFENNGVDETINKVAARSFLLTPDKALNELDKQNMRDYNQLVEDYVKVLVELVYIDTLINNLEDKTEYELDTQQLVSFGF